MGGARPAASKKGAKASAAKQAAPPAPPDDADAAALALAEQLRSLMAHMGGASLLRGRKEGLHSNKTQP